MTTILDAMTDPNLFGSFFKDGHSWARWRVLLKAIFALPFDQGDLAVFRRLTGRKEVPTESAREAWLIVGRRGGKSFCVSLIAVFLACFRDYSNHLAPGERGTVMVLAADRRQARVIFRYISALLNLVPMLAAMIERLTAESIDLANGITIEIHTASFRSVRGYTVVAALCDEIAFWQDETSANPDREILDAIRPAMATIPGALLLCIGTPYRRAGVLYEAFDRHYGKDGDPVLVVRASSRTMNPTLPKEVVAAAYERDPAAAAAEYGAHFRDDVTGFLDLAWINAAVEAGVPERPPREGIAYRAFADPSGGRADAFTLAMGHSEGERRIVDACRVVRPPFDPSAVVAEFAAVLRAYHCRTVTGDRYAGEWVTEAFRRHGIEYRAADRSKSDIYLETLPLFSAGGVVLPDLPQLTAELRALERQTRRGGRDIVDHPPRGHDDLANAACGALWLCAREQDVPILDLSINWDLRRPSAFMRSNIA